MEELKFDQPKTKAMAEVLKVLGIGSSTLIVTAGPEENVIKSARNLPKVKTMPANLLNVLDILSYKMLLMTEPAVRVAERLWENKKVERTSNASV